MGVEDVSEEETHAKHHFETKHNKTFKAETDEVESAKVLCPGIESKQTPSKSSLALKITLLKQAITLLIALQNMESHLLMVLQTLFRELSMLHSISTTEMYNYKWILGISEVRTHILFLDQSQEF